MCNPTTRSLRTKLEVRRRGADSRFGPRQQRRLARRHVITASVLAGSGASV